MKDCLALTFYCLDLVGRLEGAWLALHCLSLKQGRIQDHLFIFLSLYTIFFHCLRIV